MKILVLESHPEVRKELERAFQRIRGEVRLPDSWDIGMLTALASDFKPDFTVMGWRRFGEEVLKCLKALSGEVWIFSADSERDIRAEGGGAADRIIDKFTYGISTLVTLLVDAYKPPVSLLIAESDGGWRSILQRTLGDIPYLQMQAPENPDPVTQAQELQPDIVILSWKSFGAQVPLLRKISLHTRMDMIIGVLTGYKARSVICEGPDVDFVLNKTSPVDVLHPMVQDWVEGAQLRKRKALFR